MQPNALAEGMRVHVTLHVRLAGGANDTAAYKSRIAGRLTMHWVPRFFW